MDHLANAAIAGIQSGMVVGLGTGRAASRAVVALAQRATSERLKLTCVCTSLATEKLASELGLRTIDPAAVSSIDLIFDGADQVDAALNMIKGGGGAMTRERVIASMCADVSKRIYIIDSSKLAARLGSSFAQSAQQAKPCKLPIEVLPMARNVVASALEKIDIEGSYRTLPGGSQEFITDNQNLVLDVDISKFGSNNLHQSSNQNPDWRALAQTIRSIPGVVDHGLFLVECGQLIVEEPNAGLKTYHRPT